MQFANKIFWYSKLCCLVTTLLQKQQSYHDFFLKSMIFILLSIYIIGIKLIKFVTFVNTTFLTSNYHLTHSTFCEVHTIYRFLTFTTAQDVWRHKTYYSMLFSISYVKTIKFQKAVLIKHGLLQRHSNIFNRIELTLFNRPCSIVILIACCKISCK